jgi:hypothetical protein
VEDRGPYEGAGEAAQTYSRNAWSRIVVKRAFALAEYLRNRARGPEDLEIASLLEKMAPVCDVAREMVIAKTHEHSKAAYAEMVDLIKGKKDR